jgi:hypothetical protein
VLSPPALKIHQFAAQNARYGDIDRASLTLRAIRNAERRKPTSGTGRYPALALP